MRRPASALAAVAIVAAALSGCGSSGTPLHRVNSAVGRTAASTWVRYELSLQRPHLFSPSIAVQGGRGAYDFKTGLGYLFLQLKLPSSGYQTLFGDLEPATFLLAPSPAPAGVLPPGRNWISAPLSSSATDQGLSAQAEGLAPALLLDEIAWGVQHASAAGTHVVETVPMAEYRVTVNLATALTAAKRRRQAGVAAAIEQELHTDPSGSLTILVWVNGPGYVGKIESDIPGSKLGTTSFLFSSFTRPYTGTLPPASAVVRLASLAGGSKSVWTIATNS